MEKVYKDFLGWIITFNADPFRIETEEDVDNIVKGRKYRFIHDQLPDDPDEIWDIMCKLDLHEKDPEDMSDESWMLDYVEFEDGERAYMAIEEYDYRYHPHSDE